MPDRSKSRIRYAVVGLGHIAQVVVLPAFANARKNSELVALVSDDPVKRKELGEEYSLEHVYSYEEYDQLLQSGLIDAVLIALPNHMHCEYTVRAAEAGIHVLCEKPMAITESQCLKMITAAEQVDVRLMIAYRLQFEKSNLKAIELVQSGALGEPRIFESVFTQQVKPGDIRVRHETGGGTVPDIVSSYRVVGTEGDLRVEPAYEYVEKLTHYVTVGGKTRQQTFRVRDQFAAELLYFSRCVQTGEQPEPSGEEGLASVRVIEAIYQSATEGKPIRIEAVHKPDRPTMDQEIQLMWP